MPSRTAVVLAGGASRRFGADKLAAVVDGVPLLDVVLAGLAARGLRLVVVGSPRWLGAAVPPVVFVREEPAGGGPAAALVTGVGLAVRAGADEVVVVPGDAPGAAEAADLLLAALVPGGAAVGVDAVGAEQPLQVAHTRAAALRLLEAVGPDGAAHRRARDLLRVLDPVRVPLPPTGSWDVDTPAQLAAWRARDSPAARALADVVAAAPSGGLVVVDGRSGTGKSSLALAAAVRTGAVVVDADDFYAAPPADLTPAALAAAVYDWPRLRAAVQTLTAGRTATWRPYDWDADDGTLAAPVTVRPGRVVVLDGTYCAGPQLADLVAAEVLLEADAAVRERRVAARDGVDADHHWAAAEEHYLTHVRPPASFTVRIRTD